MSRPWEFNEGGDEEEGERHTLLEESEQKAQRLVSSFIDFAFSGNILEIAFGLILATSFTALTTSLVSDILLPPLSIILPLRRNMNEKFAVLRPGPNYDNEGGYNTLDQAQNDGAIVLAYGVFLNRIVNFLGIGLALYGLASLYQYLSNDPIIKHTVKCDPVRELHQLARWARRANAIDDSIAIKWSKGMSASTKISMGGLPILPSMCLGVGHQLNPSWTALRLERHYWEHPRSSPLTG
ncbi:large-conductance mechanosensitive channel [Annulohypoxylon moriforme]|nr:large-conductance mechanosensitive channel [Annulohypoxylon moriforme]